MTKAIVGVISFLYFVCLILIFLSFASLSYFASCLIQLLICMSVLLWGIQRLCGKDTDQIPSLFLWFTGFLFWLVIQAVGQWFQIGDFFPYVASWHERVQGITGFITAVGFYVLTVDILGPLSNSRRLVFIQALIIISALLALYLLYLALTAFNQQNFWVRDGMEWFRHLGPFAGVMIDPNFVVNLLYPGAFFALSIFFYAYRHRKEKNRMQKMMGFMLVNLCFFCVLAAGILFTFSRGGILSFGLGFLFYFVFFILSHSEKEEALARFGFVLVPLILGFIYLGVKDVFTEVQTVSGELSEAGQMRGLRLMAMRTAWQMVLDKGWFGVGLGNYEMGWLFTHQHPFNSLPPSRFNDFVWFWAETGILGIFLFLGALVTFAIKAIRKAIDSDSYFVSYMLLASVASLLTFSLHALVDPVFYTASVLWLGFIALGIGSACFILPSGVREQTIDVVHDKMPGTGMAQRILFFLFLGMAAVSTVISSVQLAAHLVAQRKGHLEDSLQLSMRLDPWNPAYPERLAAHYSQAYRNHKRQQEFDQTIWAINETFKRDKMNHYLYPRKAELALLRGGIKSAQAVFEEMRQALPDYYLGELSASIFFMEASLYEMNPLKVKLLEDLAIQAYRKTEELNPGFFERNSIYRLGSEQTHQKFELFRKQNRL